MWLWLLHGALMVIAVLVITYMTLGLKQKMKSNYAAYGITPSQAADKDAFKSRFIDEHSKIQAIAMILVLIGFLIAFGINFNSAHGSSVHSVLGLVIVGLFSLLLPVCGGFFLRKYHAY